MTRYEDRERQLRVDALRLKALASQMSKDEFLASFLGIVERERVFAEEKVKLDRYTSAGTAGPERKRLGKNIVEVR